MRSSIRQLSMSPRREKTPDSVLDACWRSATALNSPPLLRR
jgi:hypothetical protein